MAKKAGKKIEDVCIEAKNKLIELGIEDQLVSEIEWCIGSYAHDQNSSGLIAKAGEALKALNSVKKSSPKKVTKTLITDLEKVVGKK